MFEFISVSYAKGIATLALNRPEKRNALHYPLIRELLSALAMLSQDDTRVLIIHGKGENFCAGGDIAWMQKIATASEDQNYDDAQALADLLYQLYIFPKPTIVLTHGQTLGGGLGLLTAADIAISAQHALFGLPEVTIGLAPSIVSPYVISSIGERQAHYYFLTGERFGAEEALRLGLIHRVTEDHALMATGIAIAELLVKNSPQALRSAKKLISQVASQKINEDLAQKTAQHLAELRRTPEAQEGFQSFLEKRKPNWVDGI